MTENAGDGGQSQRRAAIRREQRLAEALRANLVKRKAQQRARLVACGVAGPAEPGEDGSVEGADAQSMLPR